MVTYARIRELLATIRDYNGDGLPEEARCEGQPLQLTQGTTASACGLCFQVGTPGNDSMVATPGCPTLAFGGPGNDHITGSFTEDILMGGPGNDTILGLEGEDRLHGGPGADLLIGGTHDDAISGGPDDDDMVGASGSDLMVGGDGFDQATVGPEDVAPGAEQILRGAIPAMGPAGLFVLAGILLRTGLTRLRSRS